MDETKLIAETILKIAVGIRKNLSEMTEETVKQIELLVVDNLKNYAESK